MNIRNSYKVKKQDRAYRAQLRRVRLLRQAVRRAAVLYNSRPSAERAELVARIARLYVWNKGFLHEQEAVLFMQAIETQQEADNENAL